MYNGVFAVAACQGSLMAIEFVYNNQHRILTGKVSGRLIFEEVELAMKNIVTSVDIPSESNTLWDAREMEFDNIDFEFENQLIDMIKNFNTARGMAKVAIVSGYELGAPLIKLFVILLGETSRNVQSFKTIEEAEWWLSS
ncbi:hypothetical protein MNBD_GAMMA11-1885 [hydrothermal vent metagenome]|uniref:STAS/SEC14 domain-containing protein n=1 Tax=hydrothermal vent metagenome TaxID=652676 RepID=A0A3B0X3F9_9ZZZZ